MQGNKRRNKNSSETSNDEAWLDFRKRIQLGENLVQLRDECFFQIAHDGVFVDRTVFRMQGDILLKLGDIPSAGVFYLLSGDKGRYAEEAVESAISTYGPNLDYHLKMAIPDGEFWHFEEEVQNRLKDAMCRAGVQDIHSIFQSRESWRHDRFRLLGGALEAVFLYLLVCAGVAFFLRAFTELFT
jgi:hypothetical protein